MHVGALKFSLVHFSLVTTFLTHSLLKKKKGTILTQITNVPMSNAFAVAFGTCTLKLGVVNNEGEPYLIWNYA